MLRWEEGYTDYGEYEIKYYLAIKNTISNVSGVIFKRDCVNNVLKNLQDFKNAGDRLMFINALQNGKISNSPIY